jgi:hypothetical protein
MTRVKHRRKSSARPRREAVPRGARVMEEIKNRRYLAFVRAIVAAMPGRGSR